MNRKLKNILTLLKHDWRAIIALAVYDFWLLAFPLQGYFLLRIKNCSFFPYFIIPHALTFFIIAWIGYKIDFSKLSLIGGILTSILTASFLFVSPDFQNYLFVLLGISSSFLIIRIGCALRTTEDPLLSSALGLILGNLLLGTFLLLNLPEKYLFPILGMLLLIQIPLRLYPSQLEPIKPLLKYLPFIFSFYLLIGMFYVGLMPLYLKHFYFQGIELLFYIASVFASVWCFKKRSDLSLAIGIGAGIFAVAFLHYIGHHLTINLSMYFVQMAAGFMDVFCFGMFLQGSDVIRRFALGAGCMLLGPAVGFPVVYFKKWTSVMVVSGNIILGMALVLFYTLSIYKKEKRQTKDESLSEALQIKANSYLLRNIPKNLLSPRESEVLTLLIAGKTIKEIASELEISESSVKTYLHRIYRKFDVSSKAELLKKFSHSSKILKLKVIKK